MILTKIQEAASKYPDRTAIQMKEGDRYRRLTYRELMASLASAARGLAELGIKKGDRVALLAENRPEWQMAYLATTVIGAVVVPLDAQLMDKEVALLLSNSGAKAVCVTSSTRQKLPKGTAITIISLDRSDGLSFSALASAHPDALLPPAPAADDLAAILYTSGTTGDPKGVMLSHGNLASNCASAIKLDIVQQTDNLLCLLPLHHTYPAMACMILPLSLGATVTILNSLKGPDIVACMQETEVTVLVAVPQLLTALRRAIFERIEQQLLPLRFIAKLLLATSSSVRAITGRNIGKAFFGKVHARFGPTFRLMASGGARLDPQVFRDMTALGFMVIEAYGLTETSPAATFNPLGRQKAGSIGVPIPDVEVRIVDPDDKGQGEIAIKGPNVMLGYYQKPEATAEVIRDGWFYTGDLGFRDRNGYFFITGRSKEMIVLSTGKKVFPDELESLYKQLPAIKEICLVQTDRGLEAAVVPDFDYLRKQNIANARETIAFEIEDLQKDLPSYKRVMGIKIFKDSLPVTRLGKLKRAMVRDLYLTGGERAEKAAPKEEDAVAQSRVGAKVLACLAPFSAKKQILPDDNLEIDLGLDSLSRVELVVSLERTFGIGLPDSFGSVIFTVRDIIVKLEDLLDRGAAAHPSHVRMSWAQILGEEPAPEAKALVRLVRNPLCVAGWACGRMLLKLFFLLYGRMTVRGVENLPKQGPYMITPNHLSNADAFLQSVATPLPIARQVFYLGDTKFFGGPVSSRIAQYLQIIPVDMEARLFNAMQLSAYVLRQGKVLCVFPEGARTRDGKLKEFKKGVGIIAKELNVPLVPVALTGTYEMMRPGQLYPRPAKVTVTFGKPIYPGTMSYEEITKKLYGDVVGMLEKK
ncbi:MAG: AMP-binding protein [Nitrospiraceae bacterium]|nr:AMP-binding protein [Nitrospiraceae bacterium]